MSGQRRRMLLVSTEFPPGPGGIGTHAYQLAQHVAMAGWDVTVLAPQEYVEARQAEALDVTLPFPVVRLTTERSFARRTIARVRSTRRLVSYLQPDVVVCSGNWAVWLTVAACLGRPCRVLAVGHGMEFGRPGRVHQLVNRWAYERVDVTVCVSNYTRARMGEAGVRPRRVEVIPNGGDHEVFRVVSDPPPIHPDARLADERVILSVGNVSLRKGQDVVIRALPELVRRGHDVQYVIIGLPGRQADLEVLAAELGVDSRVHFLGQASREELIRAYQRADVFAMTSREVASGDFEGYGIAVVEAALCGKAAIVTSGSGLEEAVIDGTTGLVVPPDDPEAFVDAADRMLADPELRLGLGAAAHRRAIDTGTWEARIAQYLAILDELCPVDAPTSPSLAR